MSGRNATVLSRDIAIMEQAGEALIRAGEDRLAWPLLGLVLRLRAETGLSAPGAQVFRCDPDESGGLADVIDLHGHSRRVK